MTDFKWQVQKNEPLFPDILWSRPENKNGAGKMLLVGGSLDNFANIAQNYSLAEQAGVGTCFLLVPQSLYKVTKNIPFINYAPANRSGSFASNALADILELARGVDAVFLGGDIGKNSETSLMLEKFLMKYTSFVAISQDSLLSINKSWRNLLARNNTIVEINLHNLQTIAIELQFEKAILSDSPNSLIAKTLHKITSDYESILALQTDTNIWFAKSGQVIACSKNNYNYAKAIVWLIQQPNKVLESLASSVI